MYIRKQNKGFTLIELVSVMSIMGIMLYVSSNVSSGIYRDVKFNDYAAKIEYFSKYARINSIKKSSYTGLCIQNKILTIRNMGASSVTKPCDITDSSQVIKTLDLSKETYINLVPNGVLDDDTRNSFVYDGRGLAKQPAKEICISNGGKFVKFTINQTGVIKKSKSEKNSADPSGTTICQ